MALRYWVGGSGNWNDTAHWSTTSGGSGGASAPTSVDDAFFDANSFSADGQYVQMYNSGYGQVRNLDFSAVGYAIQPRGGIKIYGDLKLSALLDTEYDYPWFWFLGTGTMNITSNGCVIFGEIDLGGDGVTDLSASSIVLLDDLTFSEDSYGIYMAGGTFDANNFNYTAPNFAGAAAYEYDASIYMGSGTWTIYDTFSIYENDPVDSYGRAYIFEETSTIHFTSPTYETNLHLKINLYQENVYFNDIVVDNMGNNYFWIGESDLYSFYADPSFIPTFHFNNFTMTRKANDTDWVNLYSTAAVHYTFNNFSVDGYDTSDYGNIFLDAQDQIGSDIFSTFEIASAPSVTNVWVVNNHATGTAAPIIPVGGRDGSGNDGWFFPVHLISVNDSISVFDAYSGPSAVIAYVDPFNGAATLGSITYENYRSLSEKFLYCGSNFLLEQVTVQGYKYGNPADEVTLSIYFGGTNGKNGTLLTTGILAGPQFPGSFVLDIPITILGGSVYWFTFTRKFPNSASTWFYIYATYYNQDSNSNFWYEDTAGTWTLGSSTVQKQLGISLENISHELIIEIQDIPEMFHESVTIKERVVLSVANDFPNVSENIYVNESIEIYVRNYIYIFIQDSIVVEDVNEPRPQVIRSGVGSDRYWIGGSGDWEDSAHWSDSSGGVGYAGIPETTNNVFFDANSFTLAGQLVIVNFTANCNNFDYRSATLGKIDFNANLNVSGTFRDGSILFYDSTNSAPTPRIKFISSNSGVTLDIIYANNSLDFEFDGTGDWIFTGGGDLYLPNVFLTQGTLDTNNYKIFANFITDGILPRGLDMGSSIFVVDREWTVLNSTNFTLNIGTSNIRCRGYITFIGGGLTYNDVTPYLRAPSPLMPYSGGVAYMGGSNSFNNLIVGGLHAISSVPASLYLEPGTTQTISGTFSNPGMIAFRGFIRTAQKIGDTLDFTPGQSATINAAAISVNLNDFMDIIGTGAASWSGTGFGDAGRNSGITFSPSVTRYWVGNSGTWYSTTHWSATSGGASGASVPLAHDNAIFDTNSFSSPSTVVSNMICHPAMDWFGIDQTVNLLYGSFSGSGGVYYGAIVYWTGNETFSSLLSQGCGSNTTTSIYITSSNDVNINFANTVFGVYIENDIVGMIIDTLDDKKVVLTSNFSGSSVYGSLRTIKVSRGIFDANGFDISTPFFDGSGTKPRSILMGSGTWTITGFTNFSWDGYKNWDFTDTTNLTFDSETSTIVFNGNDGHVFNHDNPWISLIEGRFEGGGKTYYNMTVDKTVSIYGNNTFNNLTFNSSVSEIIRLEAGSTQTVNNFIFNPTSYGTLKSTIDGNQAFIDANTSSISKVNVRDNYALGGVPFVNTLDGMDGGNNVNWTFGILCISSAGSLIQYNIDIIDGDTYKLTFSQNITIGILQVLQGTQLIYDSSNTLTPGIVTFIADSSGNYISFKSDQFLTTMIVDNISLRRIISGATNDNRSTKQFLIGNTDEGNDIVFRADTQPIQLSSNFETFQSPIAVVNRLQRGTQMKCFASIDGGEFYELQGTVNKGVSIVKVHSKDRKNIPTPPIARKMQLSWRDSSKQLCRLIQSAIIFTPGTMDYSE